MGNFQLLKSNRQEGARIMARNVLLSILYCILSLSPVQAKAVERLKHSSQNGQIQVDSQTFPVYEQTDSKALHNFPSFKIGKPLYFGHDPSQTPRRIESYESTVPDRYELSNYENLEGMFKTESEYPEKSKPQNKYEFQEDQVFLHSSHKQRVKSSANPRISKSLNFQKRNLKLDNVGPPCENADLLDYKNESINEFSSSINPNISHGSQSEQKSKGVHEDISENFHQSGTKILHRNMDVDQIETEDKMFEENFVHSNEKGDFLEKNIIGFDNGPTNGDETSEELITKTSHIEDEDRHISDSRFRSFVFNPNAQPLEKFQACKTPRNESGHCRYIQHCMLPSILSSIRHFMNNVCIIQDQFIGVCCPEFPVNVVLVNWPDKKQDFADDSIEVPEDCGVGTNRRIVGGLAADRKAWPWMVALLNSNLKFFCGGSLISNRYVLTAAHCTFGLSSNNRIVARLGEYDFNDPRDSHDDYPVIEIKRHGQYTRFTLRNDIAVLKLERPVLFNEFVRTICLPDLKKDYLGKHTTLAGWGHMNGDSNSRRSNILQEADLTVIGNEECGVTHGIPVADSVLCAAAPTKDKGACNGDSGGPLMLLDSDERWKVVGIVSWGRRGCNPTFPTAYSRVTHYLDWIREHAT